MPVMDNNDVMNIAEVNIMQNPEVVKLFRAWMLTLEECLSISEIISYAMPLRSPDFTLKAHVLKTDVGHMLELVFYSPVTSAQDVQWRNKLYEDLCSCVTSQCLSDRLSISLHYKDE